MLAAGEAAARHWQLQTPQLPDHRRRQERLSGLAHRHLLRVTSSCTSRSGGAKLLEDVVVLPCQPVLADRGEHERRRRSARGSGRRPRRSSTTRRMLAPSGEVPSARARRGAPRWRAAASTAASAARRQPRRVRVREPGEAPALLVSTLASSKRTALRNRSAASASRSRVSRARTYHLSSRVKASAERTCELSCELSCSASSVGSAPAFRSCS